MASLNIVCSQGFLLSYIIRYSRLSLYRFIATCGLWLEFRHTIQLLSNPATFEIDSSLHFIGFSFGFQMELFLNSPWITLPPRVATSAWRPLWNFMLNKEKDLCYWHALERFNMELIPFLISYFIIFFNELEDFFSFLTEHFNKILFIFFVPPPPFFFSISLGSWKVFCILCFFNFSSKCQIFFFDSYFINENSEAVLF